MADANTTVSELKDKIHKFVQVRDWENAHSPKNLSMSLAIEVAELMEHFQWITEEKSRTGLADKQILEIKEELADVAIYLLSFCNVMGIDLSDAIVNKMVKNSKKYPAIIAHKENS